MPAPALAKALRRSMQPSSMRQGRSQGRGSLGDQSCWDSSVAPLLMLALQCLACGSFCQPLPWLRRLLKRGMLPRQVNVQQRTRHR